MLRAISEMTRYLISQAPVAENRFTGQNFARYMNLEYNDLIERYLLTISKPERMEILRQIAHHQSESLHQMGLFYNVQSVAISKRTQGRHEQRCKRLQPSLERPRVELV